MFKTHTIIRKTMPLGQLGIMAVACLACVSFALADESPGRPLASVPGEYPANPVMCGGVQAIPPDITVPRSEKADRSNPCGPVVYENSGQSGSWYATGAGNRVADDCSLAWFERGACEISSLVVNANYDTATVVLELWDGCPYDDGTMILASDPFDLTPYAFNAVTWTLGAELPVGNTLWVAWTSPDENVGPVLAGTAEFGYTADVFATSDCGGDPSCTCYFGGSPYAGFDVTISAVEVPSACCLPEGTCANLLHDECFAFDGDWYIGAYCESFVCPPHCPDDTLYGHELVVPTDAWQGYTSDDAADENGYLVFDNFSGLTDPICDIHFWGLQGYHDETAGWSACEESSMKFEIIFYADNAGVPGSEVCSYTVTLAPASTGLYYDDFPLYAFGTTLETCCDLAEGWVSIQGVGDVEDCWFLWMNGYGPGDGAYQYDGATLNPIGDDLAFCLTGASLSLVPEKTCYAVGESVKIDIVMSDVSEIIRGGQFFLAYDETKLDLVSVDPGQAPFTQEVFECSDLVGSPPPLYCTPTAGLIDYAVGVPDGDPGIAGTRVMATLTFTALEELCQTANLVTWREHSPPTRLSTAIGMAFIPITADLPFISIDETKPVITGLTVTAEDGQVDDACEQAIAFSATVTDTCCIAAGDVSVEVTLPEANATLSDILVYVDQVSLTEVSITGSALVSDLIDCPATVQVTIDASDCCDNAAVQATATTDVSDPIPPVFTFEPDDLIVECDGHGNQEELDAWLATAAASDNCGGVIITSDVGDFSDECAETGSALVTWTAADGCGNTAVHMATFTIVDTAAPIITCPDDITIECDASTDPAFTGTPGYFQGFEDPAYVSGLYTDWNEYDSAIARAVSGTDGIASAAGAAHAVIDSSSVPAGYTGVFSRLGGYDSTFDDGFVVSLDVYVDLTDPAVTAVPDTYGWDLSTAASNQSGDHLRDFIFHTASNDTGHVLVAGSNNTNFQRRDDLAGINHYEIATTGWYTFQWVFRNAGDGSLAVDLNLLDSMGAHLWTETRNNPSDDIATIVGGHRYMWFTFLAVDRLAIDNTAVFDSLTAVDACDAAPLITYADDTSGLTGCNGTGTLVRTWTATDACGHADSCEQTITIVDTTPPEFTACPSDISVLADAGDCTASVVFGGAEATDTCGMDPVSPITYWLGTTQITSPHVFPGGDTLVTAQATDACGNVNDTCSFHVVVEPYSEMRVEVELSPTMFDPNPGVPGDTLTRCITFELWNCDPLAGPVVFDEEVTFSVDDGGTPYLGTAILTNVPCGDYECITARDKLHTLRRTAEIETPAGETYFAADFTGDDRLIGGNLNDDGWIDILDFGAYSWQYPIDYGSRDTDCMTSYPHADISGNGVVDTADFTFIQANFLLGREANCCSQPRLMSGDDDTLSGPVTEISTAELTARGLGHLSAADINADGRLDQADIAAFLLGQRPAAGPGPLDQPIWKERKADRSDAPSIRASN